jgi:hypothetical protein
VRGYSDLKALIDSGELKAMLAWRWCRRRGQGGLLRSVQPSFMVAPAP